MDCLYFKTNKFQYWNYFGNGIECIYYFFKEQKNESLPPITCSGGSLSGLGKNWVPWITSEELNALNHKGIFDKMHQSNWGEMRI
jgi:hypothetical protein